MKKICSSIFRVLVIPYVMCGFVAAQNSYTLNGLSELKEFTAGSVEETVENLTLIEPEGSEMIPESEILKLTDRVKKITGTLTMEGLSQLTTTTGLIDVIDCCFIGIFILYNQVKQLKKRRGNTDGESSESVGRK